MVRPINPDWPVGLEGLLVEDRRNVIDYYKYWKDIDIAEDLGKKSSDLIVMFENYANDFNIATGVRSANAFNAGAVWIVGQKKWDRRGAVGTHNYTRIEHFSDSETVINAAHSEGYMVVCVDNLKDAKPVEDYKWQKKTLLIFGQESIGVSQTALDLCDDVVYIQQYGSVRSLNVGVASGIMMHEYSKQFAPGKVS